ncbi:hypothetical protein NECAME_13533, partial [Necator americanus]
MIEMSNTLTSLPKWKSLLPAENPEQAE